MVLAATERPPHPVQYRGTTNGNRRKCTCSTKAPARHNSSPEEMSGRGSMPRGSGERRGFFGLFNSGKSSKSLDASADKKPRSHSWGIEVPLEPEAFSQACLTQKVDFLKATPNNKERDRNLLAPALSNFLTRGLRYHSGDLEACKAAASLALAMAEGPPCKALYDGGVILAMLRCCKVPFETLHIRSPHQYCVPARSAGRSPFFSQHRRYNSPRFRPQVHRGEPLLQAAFCAMGRRITQGVPDQADLHQLRLELASEQAYDVLVDTMRTNATDAEAREVRRWPHFPS